MAKAATPLSKLRTVTQASATAVTAGMIDQAPAMGLGTYFKIPSDWPIKRFGPEKNTTYKAMILPWLAGKGNPVVKPGEIAVNRYYPRHSMIGPNDEHFICPYRSSEGVRRCPVCEKLNDMRLAGVDFDTIIKGKKAKNRELLFLHFPEHSDKRNLFVWDESVALFGDALRAKIKKRPQYQLYWNLGDGGCIVEFEAKEKKIQSNSCIDCTLAIEIEPRTFPTPEWLMAACEKYCIDNILIEQPTERLKKVVMQMGGGPKPSEPDAPNMEPGENGDGDQPADMGPVDEVIDDAPPAEDAPPVEEEVVEEEQPEEVQEETVEETVEEEQVEEEVVEETYEEGPADPEEPEEPEPEPPPPPKKPAPKPAPKAAAPAAPAKVAPKPAPTKPAAPPTRPPARPPAKPAPKK